MMERRGRKSARTATDWTAADELSTLVLALLRQAAAEFALATKLDALREVVLPNLCDLARSARWEHTDVGEAWYVDECAGPASNSLACAVFSCAELRAVRCVCHELSKVPPPRRPPPCCFVRCALVSHLGPELLEPSKRRELSQLLSRGGCIRPPATSRSRRAELLDVTTQTSRFVC